MSEINLIKQGRRSTQLLTPKVFLRYAPGSMRKVENDTKLSNERAFDLNRLDDITDSETGLSRAIGFDYNINNKSSEFDFSLAQIINDKETKKMNSW